MNIRFFKKKKKKEKKSCYLFFLSQKIQKLLSQLSLFVSKILNLFSVLKFGPDVMDGVKADHLG